MDDIFEIKDIKRFFEATWGVAPKLLRAASGIQLDGRGFIESLLADRNISYPVLKLYTEGELRNPLDYTMSSRRELNPSINSQLAQSFLDEPGTFKIENADEKCEEIDRIKSSVSYFFDDSFVTTNLYHSIGPANGIPAHYDPYHIFVLQVSGSKVWNTGQNIVKNPHKDFGFNKVSESLLNDEEIETNIGDVLYLPPGTLHRAYTPVRSTHITIGVHTTRFYETVKDLLIDCASEVSELRSDLEFRYVDGRMRTKKIDSAQLSEIFKIIKNYASNGK